MNIQESRAHYSAMKEGMGCGMRTFFGARSPPVKGRAISWHEQTMHLYEKEVNGRASRGTSEIVPVSSHPFVH